MKTVEGEQSGNVCIQIAGESAVKHIKVIFFHKWIQAALIDDEIPGNLEHVQNAFVRHPEVLARMANEEAERDHDRDLMDQFIDWDEDEDEDDGNFEDDEENQDDVNGKQIYY